MTHRDNYEMATQQLRHLIKQTHNLWKLLTPEQREGLDPPVSIFNPPQHGDQKHASNSSEEATV
jgi:hypothetical protein